MNFVYKQSLENVDEKIKMVIIEKIINFYFDFHQGESLQNFLIKNIKKVANYDIINFINFGIANKIFKRLYEYPVNFKKTKHKFFKKN